MWWLRPRKAKKAYEARGEQTPDGRKTCGDAIRKTRADWRTAIRYETLVEVFEQFNSAFSTKAFREWLRREIALIDVARKDLLVSQRAVLKRKDG